MLRELLCFSGIISCSIMFVNASRLYIKLENDELNRITFLYRMIVGKIARFRN